MSTRPHPPRAVPNRRRKMNSKRNDGKQKRVHDYGMSSDAFNGKCEPEPVFPILRLPDAAMSRAFSFLPFKERVHFAMILPAWKEEQTQDITKTVIAAEPVDSIDLLDLGDDVASELLDGDLKHILESIDAVDNLKSLKLTHCYKIVGHGLQPISGSRVLQTVDLSLVARYEPLEAGVNGLISTEAVLPILSSIIESQQMPLNDQIIDNINQVALRNIELPGIWRNSRGEDLIHFLSIYSNLGQQCVKCNRIDFRRGITDFPYMMSSYRTCYECTSHYCATCSFTVAPVAPILQCNKCRKNTCNNCDPVRACDECEDHFCTGCWQLDYCERCELCFECANQCGQCLERGCHCYVPECSGCEDFICHDCGSFCDDCDFRYCTACSEINMFTCDSCGGTRCFVCQRHLVEFGHVECRACLVQLYIDNN